MKVQRGNINLRYQEDCLILINKLAFFARFKALSQYSNYKEIKKLITKGQENSSFFLFDKCELIHEGFTVIFQQIGPVQQICITILAERRLQASLDDHT